MHDFSLLQLQLHNKWFKIKKIFESRTVDTVHVPLSPYRMLFLTYILYCIVLEFYTVYEIYIYILSE